MQPGRDASGSRSRRRTSTPTARPARRLGGVRAAQALERGGRALARRAHPLIEIVAQRGQDRAAQFRRGARRFDQIGAVAITRSPCSRTSGGH